MSIFNQKNIPVTQFNAHLHKPTMETTINATIYVADAMQLNDIFALLKNIRSVNKIERVTH